MKSVGVKYCGGCRCLYDRQARFQEIRELSANVCTFEYAKCGKPYDILLVLSGCTAQCADIGNLSFTAVLNVIPSMSASSAADILGNINI